MKAAATDKDVPRIHSTTEQSAGLTTPCSSSWGGDHWQWCGGVRSRQQWPGGGGLRMLGA